MDKEEAKEIMPILKAFLEGRQIQWLNCNKEWEDINDIILSNIEINPNQYRIKPEPKYRPFKTQEECWEEMHKHPDFGWIKETYTKAIVQIGRLFISPTNNPRITLSIDEGVNYNVSEIFRNFVFTDDTPFGVKEE